MTDSESADQPAMLKTDVIGRIRTTHEQREALLDAFEVGGLSGPEFARVHGINYQTFATWRQKRRRQRCEYPNPPKQKTEEQGFTLIEAEVGRSQAGSVHTSAEGLLIELDGGAKMKVTNADDISLAVSLIKALKP